MEYEIRADLEHLALELGCDHIGNLAVGSAPSGQMTRFTPHFFANRRIEPGDNLSVMIEVAGPGGQYGELARTWCLDEPTESLQWLFDVARSCQIYLAEKIRPGLSGSELNNLYNDYMKQHGLPENGRYFGHGQGYDMMERPAFAARENMVFKEDMFLAIHPEIVKGQRLCDLLRQLPRDQRRCDPPHPHTPGKFSRSRSRHFKSCRPLAYPRGGSFFVSPAVFP